MARSYSRSLRGEVLLEVELAQCYCGGVEEFGVERR
jgi:hypothetical protein